MMIRICQDFSLHQNLITQQYTLICTYFMQFVNMFDDLPQEEFPSINFPRTMSKDNLFSNILAQPTLQAENIIGSLGQNVTNFTQNYSSYKKQPKIIQKDKKKAPVQQKKDYKKNICGYITKKIVREFISQSYKQLVQNLCRKHNADYSQCKQFYLKKIQRITGPTHLEMLISPDGKGEIQLKKVFKEFFNWFLRHRYIRYLLSEGKMDKKQVYIDYKNKTLLYLTSGDLQDLKRIQMNEESFDNKDTCFHVSQ